MRRSRSAALSARLALASVGTALAVGVVCAVGLFSLGNSSAVARVAVSRQLALIDDAAAMSAFLYQKGFVAEYLLTGNRHAAEEAAQAALVRTYAAWPRVRRDDAFAYARRVLVNYVTDRWRRRLREYAASDLPEPAAGTDLAEQVVQRQWLISALATLTLRERAVIIIRYLFDLPEAVVARDLGITPGTVKSTSSRALAKLRVNVNAEDGATSMTGGDRL